MKHFFLLFFLATSLATGCASTKWDHLVEYDDVYVVQADEIQEMKNLETIANNPDSVENLAKQKKPFEFSPRFKRAMTWIGGAILQIGFDVALYFLLL